MQIVGQAAFLVCLIFQSSPSLATMTVPFMSGMRLGTAFDYSKFKVGNSLVEDSIRNGAVERRNDMSNMKFKMIKSQKDISDVLDVSGELSVKVMAGLVDVQGKGSYLKSSLTSENTVEVLAQIYYRTVTKTITDDAMIPISDWRNKIDGDKHYIRSVTYGGYLIASLKYTAKKDETKQDIQASVEVNVNTKKVNVGIKGQFQSLAESANSIANLQISYTLSALPDETPVDLDSILKAISDFPNKIKESKDSIGVPIEVEIRELKYLRGSEELNYVISGLVAGKICRFELMFADLESTYDAIDKLVTDPKHAKMDDYLAALYGRFQSKVDGIKRQFYRAINNLDLKDKPGNLDQLTKALEAYRDGDKGFVPGKYSRQLKRLQKEDPLPVPLDEVLKEREKNLKNNELKKDIKKNIENLTAEISSFETYVSVPRTCRDIQGGYPSIDGEHDLYLKLPECTQSARIYCADMNTANPKEYITLPAKGAQNFAHHFNKNTKKEEITRFEKIRLNIDVMSVNIYDYKFATASPEKNVYHPYASAGDCGTNVWYDVFRFCSAATKKGNFKVDISGTDFLLPKSIPYSFYTYPACARKVFKKLMSPDRKKWSGYCGGYCGNCWPRVFHLLVEGC